MREIKFRAWDNVNKIMFPNVFDHPDFLLEDMMEQPKIFFIMQYTGLKDKNGKEVYEGDIIKNEWVNCNGDDIGQIWEVKFGEHMTSSDYYASSAYGWYADNHDVIDGTNCLHNLPTSSSMSGKSGGIVILGNIYENPELLDAKA